MSQLFGRVCRLSVGSLMWTDLRVSFEVQRTLGAKPNPARITVYGLSESSRAAVAIRGTEVRLFAGYRDNAALIFGGQVRRCTHTKQTDGWHSDLECADGLEVWRKNVSASWARGTPRRQVIEQACKVLGLPPLTSSQAKLVTGQLDEPLAMYGLATQQADLLFRSLGLEWSVQSGELQLLRAGGLTTEQAVVLTPETGLVGVPEVEPAQSGRAPSVRVTSLLQPTITPGRLLQVESRTWTGRVRPSVVEYTGDTHGSDWYVRAEGRQL